MSAGLVLTDLAVGYGRPLIGGITMAIAPGEIACLIGQNASGKSTLLRTIAGIRPALAGQILVDGRRIEEWPVHRRATEGNIGYVRQSQRNFPGLSVEEHLSLAFWGQAVAVAERRRTVASLLEREVFAPVRRRLAERADRLSGGEDLLLAVARTLLRRPAVILFDEPSAGLFVRYRNLVVDVIRSASDGAAVLVVEQMSAVVDSLPGRVYRVQHHDSGVGLLNEVCRAEPSSSNGALIEGISASPL